MTDKRKTLQTIDFQLDISSIADDVRREVYAQSFKSAVITFGAMIFFGFLCFLTILNRKSLDSPQNILFYLVSLIILSYIVFLSFRMSLRSSFVNKHVKKMRKVAMEQKLHQQADQIIARELKDYSKFEKITTESSLYMALEMAYVDFVYSDTGIRPQKHEPQGVWSRVRVTEEPENLRYTMDYDYLIVEVPDSGLSAGNKLMLNCTVELKEDLEIQKAS